VIGRVRRAEPEADYFPGVNRPLDQGRHGPHLSGRREIFAQASFLKPIMRKPILIVLFALSLSLALAADVVTPSSDVTSRVIVRQTASAQSARIGSLEPGQQAELIGSVPNWHEIRLSNGLTGFVPKRWTQVIPAGDALSQAVECRIDL
jgi:Bacterial SH3 domain